MAAPVVDDNPSARSRRGIRIAVFGVGCAVIVLFNLWLIADHEIVVGLSPVDELYFIRKGQCTYWFDPGYHHDTSFLKEAPYPLLVAASYRLGIPLRIAHELFFLLAAGALAACLVYRQTHPVVGLTVFAAATLIPARLYVFRQPLHDAIYSSALLLAVAALVWQLKRMGEAGRWRRWFATGLALGLLWNIRQERQLVLVLLGTFFVVASTVMMRRDTRAKTVGAWLVEWTPGLAIAMLITAGLMVANYARWGVFVTSEFAAPSMATAYRALLRIAPERPILYVPITKEVRERAYAASPAFRQLEPWLEGQTLIDRAPNWRYFQNIPDGEYSGGWFIFGLRDAAAAAGFAESARDMEAFFAQVASELSLAEKENKLPTRSLLPGLGWAVNPDIALYWHMLLGSWRSMWFNCWSFRSDLYEPFDPPETPPEIKALFDRVANRRAVTTKTDGLRADTRRELAIAFARYSQFVLAGGCFVGGAVLLLLRRVRFDWKYYILPACVFGIYGLVRIAIFALFDAGAFPGADIRYLFPATLSLTIAAVWLLSEGVYQFFKSVISTYANGLPTSSPTARFASGTALLVGGVLLVAQWGWEKRQPPDFIGQAGSLEAVEEGTMRGWARLREHPRQPVDVGFFEGDKLVGSVVANQEIAEVTRDFPFAAGLAFRCPVPAELRDGNEHRIVAKIIGTSCILSNTPTTIRVDPSAPNPWSGIRFLGIACLPPSHLYRSTR